MNGYGSHRSVDDDDVDEDPDDDDDGLDDEEAGGAEVAGDGLGELAEGLGVVVDAEAAAGPAGTRQVLAGASRADPCRVGALAPAGRQRPVEHVVDGDGAEQPPLLVAHRRRPAGCTRRGARPPPARACRAGPSAPPRGSGRGSSTAARAGGAGSARHRGRSPSAPRTAALVTKTCAAIDTSHSGSRTCGQRLGDGGGGAEDDDVRRHQRAGRALPVGEEAAQHVGLLRRPSPTAAACAGRRASRPAGRPASSDSISSSTDSQPVEVEPLDDAQLLVLGQLLEQVGQAVVLHGLGQLPALGQREEADRAGHVARVHVAQAGGLGAISLPVKRLGTSSQSTMRNDGRRTSGRRRARRTFSTIHLVVRPAVWRRAMSLTVSSPMRVSMTSLPTMISPALGLNGFTSRSHERRRAPSLLSSARRLAFTKTRRRWTAAEKPMTSGGSAPREGRSTMSFSFPMATPSGASRGRRITRNA